MDYGKSDLDWQYIAEHQYSLVSYSQRWSPEAELVDKHCLVYSSFTALVAKLEDTRHSCRRGSRAAMV